VGRRKESAKGQESAAQRFRWWSPPVPVSAAPFSPPPPVPLQPPFSAPGPPPLSLSPPSLSSATQRRVSAGQTQPREEVAVSGTEEETLLVLQQRLVQINQHTPSSPPPLPPRSTHPPSLSTSSLHTPSPLPSHPTFHTASLQQLMTRLALNIVFSFCEVFYRAHNSLLYYTVRIIMQCVEKSFPIPTMLNTKPASLCRL